MKGTRVVRDARCKGPTSLSTIFLETYSVDLAETFTSYRGHISLGIIASLSWLAALPDFWRFFKVENFSIFQIFARRSTNTCPIGLKLFLCRGSSMGLQLLLTLQNNPPRHFFSRIRVNFFSKEFFLFSNFRIKIGLDAKNHREDPVVAHRDASIETKFRSIRIPQRKLWRFANSVEKQLHNSTSPFGKEEC